MLVSFRLSNIVHSNILYNIINCENSLETSWGGLTTNGFTVIIALMMRTMATHAPKKYVHVLFYSQRSN